MTGVEAGDRTPKPKPQRPDVDRKARLQIGHQRPEKQAPESRTANWGEVFLLFEEEAAKVEAERCIQCPAAPCQTACPVENDIPAALWKLEQGDFAGAADIFRQTSELPEMCGRLCPQERLCEGHCVVGKKALPVEIGKLETFTTEWQHAHGGPPKPKPVAVSGRSVAVVGSGPAGIACAERLARAGHRVVIYEAWSEPGGLLLYGIPTFKQNKPAVTRKFEELAALGVELVTNTRVGEDVSMSQLEQDHDAVFLGFGAPVGAELKIGHEDAAGVYQATEFLVRTNLDSGLLPEELREALPAPRRVAVVGGGDTSMDCVRSAVRLGAEVVTLIYRRTEEEMQGRVEEREHAVEEGVLFEYLAAPLEVLVDDDGHTRGLRCQRMRLGESDESGRSRPEPVPGSEFDVEADAVVVAIGYNVDPAWGEYAPDILRDRWDRLVADPETMKTNYRGVFAGGDNVNGADLVVTALAGGQLAAAAIERYLEDGDW